MNTRTSVFVHVHHVAGCDEEQRAPGFHTLDVTSRRREQSHQAVGLKSAPFSKTSPCAYGLPASLSHATSKHKAKVSAFQTQVATWFLTVRQIIISSVDLIISSVRAEGGTWALPRTEAGRSQERLNTTLNTNTTSTTTHRYNTTTTSPSKASLHRIHFPVKVKISAAWPIHK